MLDLSIIIPTFKRPKSLERALASIYNQNPDNIQVIVVDDCEECSGFDATLKYPVNYYSKKLIDKGVSESRNIAIKLAVGRFVLFLDDDDYLIEGSISIFKEKINHG